MALCYVMLLVASGNSYVVEATGHTMQPEKTEFALGSQRQGGVGSVDSDVYIPIKEVARRQWCEERRRSSQAVALSLSARGDQLPGGVWCGEAISAYPTKYRGIYWTEPLPRVLRSFGSTLSLPNAARHSVS